ncbi:MAG: hypothetical protein JXB10_18915 [Pirellulales bacterium]|nr:hypothetical protein [Pirellulales bacterium]
MHRLFLVLILTGWWAGNLEAALFPWIYSASDDDKLCAAPFQLEPKEEGRLNRVLKDWEKACRKITSFECKFKRWEYLPTLASLKEGKNQPVHVDYGILKNAVPNQWKYQTLYTDQPGDNGDSKVVPIEKIRAERILCDGKRVYFFDATNQCLHEYPFLSESQGTSLMRCFFPQCYLLTIEAETLQRNYYLRLVTPGDRRDQIWIEMYPRLRKFASFFGKMVLILEESTMTPQALRIVFPGGKNSCSYMFYDTARNTFETEKEPMDVILPQGWRKEIHPPALSGTGKTSAE